MIILFLLRCKAVLYFFFHKKKNDVIYLMHPSIGDMVYGLTYANAFNNKLTKEGKRLIIYSDKKKKDIVECYNLSVEIRYIEKEVRFINYLYYSRTFLKLCKDIGIVTNTPYYYIKEPQTETRDNFKLLREEILNLGTQAKKEFPQVNEKKVKSIDNIESCKDKIVIINPYSTSSFISINLFEKIAEDLIKRGYDVYTNVLGEEHPLRGTKRLDCCIFEFYNICNQIPFVISVRSGLIDLCVSTNAKFFIIYDIITKGEGFSRIYNLSSWETKNITNVFSPDEKIIFSMYLDFIKG